MNFSRSTFALVTLNVAWLAAASYLIARAFRGGPGPARVEYVTNYVPVAKSGRLVVTNTVAAGEDFRWAQLESEDYRTYIERLRSIGCPEQTIRDIVIADVDKLLAPRMQAASLQPKELNYWEPVELELWNADHSAALRQQRSIDFEKREVLRELLSLDLAGERLKVQGQDDYYGARLAFLPEERRARVRLLLDQFSDREQALFEVAADEGPDGISVEALNRLRHEKRDAVAQLLAPHELEQFDLWFSPAGMRTREAVFGMEASQEEFLDIYQVQREIEEMAVAAGEADARLRAALGDERYEDFVRSQDVEYRDLYALAARAKLPRAAAVELHNYQRLAEAERANIEADGNLSLDQKAAAHQAITEETHRAFEETLGEKAFKHYLRRAGSRAMRGQ